MLSSTRAIAADIIIEGKERRYLSVINIALAGEPALARLVGPIIDIFRTVYFCLRYQIMLLIRIIGFNTGEALIMKNN